MSYNLRDFIGGRLIDSTGDIFSRSFLSGCNCSDYKAHVSVDHFVALNQARNKDEWMPLGSRPLSFFTDPSVGKFYIFMPFQTEILILLNKNCVTILNYAVFLMQKSQVSWVSDF